MRRNRVLLTIGIIEILIGAVTLLANFNTLTLSSIIKPINVSCFVLITSIISMFLGVGILRFDKRAYDLLLYFSSVIVLSKLLIFMNIIELNGALQTSIPPSFQDIISVVYHLGIIFYLRSKDIQTLFNRDFSIREEINLAALRENRF